MIYGESRGTNMLDGGAPFYEVYETQDGLYVAVGAIEAQFFKNLLRGMDIPLEDDLWNNQLNTEEWPAQRVRFAKIFKTKSQSDWAKIFSNSDACVTPVVNWKNLEDDPHAKARGLLIDCDGERQISPAPLLSRTPARPGAQEPEVGAHTEEILVMRIFISSF